MATDFRRKKQIEEMSIRELVEEAREHMHALPARGSQIAYHLETGDACLDEIVECLDGLIDRPWVPQDD